MRRDRASRCHSVDGCRVQKLARVARRIVAAGSGTPASGGASPASARSRRPSAPSSSAARGPAPRSSAADRRGWAASACHRCSAMTRPRCRPVASAVDAARIVAIDAMAVIGCIADAIARQAQLPDRAMSDDFYRIKRLPPYVIAEVNAMRAAARAAGEDIIDLGMGNPDLPPPQHVIDKLCEVAQKPDAHGYSQSKGIPGPAQGAGELLRPPLRRRARSRDRGRRHDGIEGRARQPRHRDHRAGRRRARAQPELPDPHLRLHHRRRDDPRGADDARRALFRERSSARWPSPCRARRCWSSTIRRTRPPRRSTSPSTSGSSPGRRRTRSGSSPTSPIPSSITTATRRLSILQVPGAKDVAVEFTSLSQDLFDGRLADRLRGRQQAS